MNYSIDDINTKEECDALLKTATDRKTDIEICSYRKRKRYNSKLKKLLSIEERTKDVKEEIAGFEAAVSQLEEGQLKKDIKHRLIKLNHKKYLLDQAAQQHTWTRIVRYQYRIKALKGSEEVVDDLIGRILYRMKNIDIKL